MTPLSFNHMEMAMHMMAKAGLGGLAVMVAACGGGRGEEDGNETAPTAAASTQFEDIPGNLPIHPGVERVQRMNGSPSASRPNGSRIVNYNLEAEPRAVMDFYVAAIRQAGYSVRQRSDYDINSELKIDGATEGLHVTARRGQDGRTYVQIIDYAPQ